MAANTAKKKTTSAKGSTASKKGGAANGTSAKAARSDSGRVTPVPVQEPERESENPMIMREAVLWLVLAVCILIFISYLGIGGYVGNVISDVSFGVFGITAYLFPFLLFIAAAFLISNRGSRVAGVKFLSSLGLFVCICGFATLFTKDYQEIKDIVEIYEHSASYKNGGGVIGGLFCGLFRPAFGAVGTGIVLLILSIICLVLITQKSLMRSVKHQGSRVYQSAKESNARRREAYRRERERRDEWDLPQEFMARGRGRTGSNAADGCAGTARDRIRTASDSTGTDGAGTARGRVRTASDGTGTDGAGTARGRIQTASDSTGTDDAGADGARYADMAEAGDSADGRKETQGQTRRSDDRLCQGDVRVSTGRFRVSAERSGGSSGFHIGFAGCVGASAEDAD